MAVDSNAEIEISAFAWVPPFAKGLVRDLRVRWALEEAGLPYRERLLDATTERPKDYFPNSRSARSRSTATAASACSRPARSCCTSPSVRRR